jgi:cardiolipin synthase
MPHWVPNAISVLRLALVPWWLLLAFNERARVLAGSEPQPLSLLVVLALLGGSDIADGTLARRFRLVSNVGATLDAVADKFAQIATVTFLAWFARPAFTELPMWLWGSLVSRDALLGVGWLTVWLRERKVRVEHHWHGKAASLLLFALVVAATARVPERWVALGSATALGLIVPSTLAYLREGWHQLTRPRLEPRRTPQSS